MFKNALVGVDGTSNGRDAIAIASRLLDSEEGKLTLAHVRPGVLRPTHAAGPGLLEEEREDSHELLKEQREAGEVEAELVSVVAASPGRGLHDEAERMGADLLVVGSCHRGMIGRVMLGDDTRAALNGSPCAVAIAARGYAEHPAPLEAIGVGYNDSPESHAALAKAREIAARYHSEIRAMEVVSIPNYAFTGIAAPALGESIEGLVKDSVSRLAKLEGVDGHAVYGLTGEELATFGDSVQLLVVGSRGYGPVHRLISGSTSDYLERHARCSLLVLPRGGEPGAQVEETTRA